MNESMEKRACDLAVYILEHQGTVRSAAKAFGISKSTVHKDISDRLYHINHSLYTQVKAVLDVNKAERHIRGGMATKQKYRKESVAALP
ncbi:MAG: sporulation transcriptional regulator SpoIIID [Oscillospiraceae bacterium]|nr:sporulation transcriptional regulator SpoIIID [Oscillospiraceae bacterium]